MTEFDQRGFAAVEAFFGGGDDDDAINNKNESRNHMPVTPTNHHGGMKGRRGGVGVVEMQSSSSQPKLRIDKHRIMQVGDKNKRKRLMENDDEEALIEQEGDDYDDGDEFGRTAIATKLSDNNVPNLSASLLVKDDSKIEEKKGKRKKGKKERAREKEAECKTREVGQSQVVPEQNNSLNTLADGHFPEKEATHHYSVKPKRRKVRSKQKNIYKDRREVKPAHLLPGSMEYKGRPITPETRAKLNLPPSKNSLRKQNPDATSNWETETDAPRHTPSFLRANDNVNKSEAYENIATNTAKVKKKKSKYKNLN